MTKNKKYTNFTLVTETGTTQTESYADAFAYYKRAEESATLYGIDFMGNMNVIFSK